MWKLEPTDEYERRLKSFTKKHPNELIAVHRNLHAFLAVLEKGVKPQDAAKSRHIHAEPMGILAIDERGGGGNLKATRLYVFLEVDEEVGVVHLITIGDKKTQHDDIEYSKKFARSRNQKGKGDD